MLTSATKRKIDNARDILVGKIPMPTAQVEQITLALIYKFMSDIDKKSKALGDTSGFFANGYEKYAWDNLMDKSLPARDRVTLYSEGLEKMSKNPHIPQLFRDIFKNAFLPFRSPETLKLFLEQIDEFQYDHSEELGNAFEYLLSVMGSQGDAGQFRTPRHIIDFIVKVVDPSKTDTILDPACGTAGFLISAYKHIREKGLTAEEQKKLTDNFVGYDISHDMQRLAMVNMYLHHFPDPKIFEYDTLSSEDRWDDDFDVILANPPFMTPKGGIKPHSRFSVKSKKAEVLFTDYIIGHLNQSGKAGVIVPEGIIFQSQTAYKELRRLMIDGKNLWAVVSLPAGVFNPYSGVKTSILFFDRKIADKTKDILFVKIASDGFDLGAQRKKVKTNDLPEALLLLTNYKRHFSNEENFKFNESSLIEFISKSKIKNSRDFNLSADRYNISDNVKNTKYKVVKIGDLCTLSTGGTPRSSEKKYYEGGDIKWLVSGDIHKGEIFDCEGRITELGLKESNAKLLPINSVLIALNGQGKTRGTVAILRVSATCNQSLVSIDPKDKSELLPEYLYYVLKGMYEEIRNLTGDNQRSGLNMPLIRNIDIPLPPIEIQQGIVNEIETIQKENNRLKNIIDENEKKVKTKIMNIWNK